MMPAPDSTASKPLELLSPAGDAECIRAAVENGADAVYFGLENGFNARARATNLHLDAIGEIMRGLRERNVRGYVTLNTLVFTDELPAIERVIVALTQAGVDAVLVQDLGLVRLIRAMSPDLAVHASTQMTLSSAACIQKAAELGLQRVVLPRELSTREIARIRRDTAIELEVFVHGALCVAYSGQCLTSESLGGRSANRGQCAQACRLPYDLVCDGQDVDVDNRKYLLSPQDLAGYALVPDLLAAGVQCLKIEGRLKTPEYVANVTQHYRRAIDAALAARPFVPTADEVTDLELSFSRGFAPGWLAGNDHKRLVPAVSSAKRGVRVGEVRGTRGARVIVALSRSLKPGDGVVFAGDRATGEEQGGRIYEVFESRGLTEIAFAHGAIDLAKLYRGQALWLTDDPKLTARLRRTFTGGDPQRRVSVDLDVAAAVGKPLRIDARADSGATAQATSDEPLAEARKHPLSVEVLREQLGRLGGSVYALRNLEAKITGGPMVPLSVLGSLRRQLLEGLANSLTQKTSRRIDEAARPAVAAMPRAAKTLGPQLHVLCRSLPQLREVLDFGARSVMVDFQDIRQYREASAVAAAAAAELWIATPRIQKPGEEGMLRVLARHDVTGWLVRNLAGVAYCRENNIKFVADFSLNAANPYTVDYLVGQGAERVTVSYDLNRDQLLELVPHVPADRLEVVVHQHMPMFHMEHCVFCAMLSPGTNKTNCGRPCDRHEVKLRDRVGAEHVLTADVGCRNTLFNAVPQSAAEAVPTLLERGVPHFRVELLEDHGAALRTTLKLYQHLLAGRIAGSEVWRKLKASNRVGVTRGTLEERRNPLAIL